MNNEFIDNLSEKLEDVKGAGLYKSERVITSQPEGFEPSTLRSEVFQSG